MPPGAPGIDLAGEPHQDGAADAAPAPPPALADQLVERLPQDWLGASGGERLALGAGDAHHRIPPRGRVLTQHAALAQRRPDLLLARAKHPGGHRAPDGAELVRDERAGLGLAEHAARVPQLNVAASEACGYAVRLRLDGRTIAHKNDADACLGSGEQPASDVPLACWLPVKDGLTPHGLRHSHKTWMAEDGIPEILAEQRLGHQVPGMRRLYAYASQRMRDELTADLQARWEESLRERAAIDPHSTVPLLDTLLAPFRTEPAGHPRSASSRLTIAANTMSSVYLSGYGSVISGNVLS
jgi:hypothetical protein